MSLTEGYHGLSKHTRPFTPYDVVMVSQAGNPNTESESLFEEYLSAHGHTGWGHEPPVEGKSKRLDYRLVHGGTPHFFEVKEFDEPAPMTGFGYYDPYGPIRNKIHQAKRQFQEYREFPCSLVLANPKGAFVQLGDPRPVLGAMLGNPGFHRSYRDRAKENEPLQEVFLGGGKMVDEKRRRPQNTTVSSILVLGTFPLREKLIRVAIKRRQAELGRMTTMEEDLALYETIPDSPELRRVRVYVYENPHARFPLPRNFFDGHYDQRWGAEDGFINRIYAGSELVRYEIALGEK